MQPPFVSENGHSYLYLGMEKGHKRASTEVTSVASWRTSGDAGRTVGTALARRPQIGEHMAARRAVVSHARMQQSRPPGYREESDEASITEGIGGGDERWRVAPDGLVETAAWRHARAKWCQPDAAQAAAMRPYFASSKRMCREPGRPAEAKRASIERRRLPNAEPTLHFRTETVGGNVTEGGLTAACTLRRMPASRPEVDGAAEGEAAGTNIGGGGVLSGSGGRAARADTVCIRRRIAPTSRGRPLPP